MKSVKDIKQSIRKLKVEPSDQIHTRVLDKLLRTLDKSKQTKSAAPQPNIWRVIMKSRITKLAAAAVIIIAVMIGINHFGGSIDGASVAFGQMKQALEKVLWVHSVNNNSSGNDEGWLSFTQQIEINKKANGKVTYKDYAERIKYVYSPETETITRTDISNKKFALGTTDVLAIYNETPVEIWEIVRPEDNRTEEIKMYIDTENRLPLAVEVRYGNIDSNPDYVGNITFDYPENGPQDIYALGVPQSAKIIDLLPEPDVLDVLRTYQQYRNDALSRYAAVVIFDTEEAVSVEKDVSGFATIIYRDGQRQYGQQYKIFGTADEYADQMGDIFVSVMNWCRQSNLTELNTIDLFNGVYHYQASYNADDDKWESQPRRDYPEHLGNYLEVLRQKGWPRIGIKSKNRPDLQVRIIENEYSQKYGLICIERLRQGMNYGGKHKAMPPTMQLYYLNPQKDYICQRLEEYRRLTAPWQKDKSWLNGIDPNNIRPDATIITQVAQYGQTDLGKWYPKVVTRTGVGVRKDGTPGVFTINETIYLEIAPEFPEGIFDAKNLPK